MTDNFDQNSTQPDTSGLDPQERDRFIENFGLFFEQIGVNRTAGRIVGWLMISDPPHQTLDEITAGLQMAKSTVSTSARLLTEFGLLDRISLPGIRADYYKLSEDFNATALERGLQQIIGFRAMAEQGLALLEGQPEERRARLQELYSLYSFLEVEYPTLLERWRERTQRNDEDTPPSAEPRS